MKKILVATNHSYMLYRFRKELIAALLEHYEVYISTPFVGHEQDFADMGCHMLETEIERRGTNPFHDLRLIHAYEKIIQEVKPDFIMTYSIKPNLYLGRLARHYHIAYAVNVQGLGTAFERKSLSGIVSRMYADACRKAVTVFFENKENLDFFVQHKIVPESQTTLLPGAGIDLKQYHIEPYEDHADKRFHFLYLGRIMREKGNTELYDAAERLYTHRQDFVLDVVGFYEDAYKERTEQLVRKGIVQFYGFQSDPVPYYRQADCVVLPSYHEGMSNVLLEASAMGRPVITTNIAGCREAVEEGKNGFLVPVKDTESLCRAMEKVMSLSVEERKQMGLYGRKKMERQFDRNTVVERVIHSCQLQEDYR